jgi:hypothetical protein
MKFIIGVICIHPYFGLKRNGIYNLEKLKSRIDEFYPKDYGGVIT